MARRQRGADVVLAVHVSTELRAGIDVVSDRVVLEVLSIICVS